MLFKAAYKQLVAIIQHKPKCIFMFSLFLSHIFIQESFINKHFSLVKATKCSFGLMLEYSRATTADKISAYGE